MSGRGRGDNERRIKELPMKRGDAIRALREMINYRNGVVGRGECTVAKLSFLRYEIRAMERAIDALNREAEEEDRVNL
jgi:cob(I)alamin adenosyltransferase